MLTRQRPSWHLPESAATPEQTYLDRRRVLAALGMGGIGAIGAAAIGRNAFAKLLDPSEALAPELFPAPRNEAFVLDRPVTEEELAVTYNNFYEFGSHKQIWRAAQSLIVKPWSLKIDGLVAQEREIDAEELIRAMPVEERLYRHRCVEAWAMAVPWTGFPLKALIDWAEPLGSAKYVRFETFEDSSVAPGQRQFWYPWPYVEGLTMAEASHDLSLIATGLYGKPMPKQNGSPIRLVVPWKYGFTSIKSIARISFVEERPLSFWEEIQGSEYGFWANVNPEVPHPRWSQAEERMLGSDEKVPTLLYNGYADEVAGLYAGLEGERLFM